MAHLPATTAVAEPISNHGLRFMNSAWNDTISNGETFNLNWDKNLHGIDADLGVFRMSYLDEGIIAYKLTVDLSDLVEARVARWTPKDLNESLYVFWLRTGSEENPRWAVSEPWTPKEPPDHGFRWATPIGIPIGVMMGIYLICLVTCLFYRRRRKARTRQQLHEREHRERRAMLAAQSQRLQQQLNDQSDDPLAADRHPSVSSVDTAQTLTEDELQKPEVAILLETPPRMSGARRPSHPDLFGHGGTGRRPSQPDLFGYGDQGRRPSQPDLFGYSGAGRRPSHPDLFIETLSARRRPSRPDLYAEISPTRRPSRPELFVDGLPATEVGKAL